MNFYNKKVLALPFGDYFPVIEKVFQAGKKQWGWSNKFVSTSTYFKPYESFLDSSDDIYVLPDLLRKQAWEHDLAVLSKVEKIMREAEKRCGIPVNRILLSNERKIGRAYSKSFYYWPEDNHAKSALKDSKVAGDVLRRAFHFAISVFEDFQPDLCLGAPTGGIINAVFYFVAQYFNTPYIACMASLTVPGHHLWTAEWGSFNTDIDSAYKNLLAKNTKASSAALEYVHQFRHQPKPIPLYLSMWQDKRNQVNLRNINRSIVSRLIHRLVPIIKGERIANPKPFFQLISNSYREYFLIRFQKHLYQTFTDDELSGFKYIYYPFHLDPEIVLNVQAPMFHNQLNTIKMLSCNLPAGYKLLVREHRYNVGRRATSYLKEIKSYPGVVLIDGFDDQYKYIKNADIVVTVNGTTGFEGLMLKRPVLTLDRTYYDAANLTHSFRNYNDLGRLIIDTINANPEIPDYDDRLALLLDAEKQVTLSDEAAPEQEIDYIQGVLDRLKRGVDVTTQDTVQLL